MRTSSFSDSFYVAVLMQDGRENGKEQISMRSGGQKICIDVTFLLQNYSAASDENVVVGTYYAEH